MPSLALAGTCGNGYSYGPIEIKLQKATGSDQTNFPFIIDGTYPFMKTVANGGQVQNSAANSIGITGPADVVISDSNVAGNCIKYETETWSGSTGRWIAWGKASTLHSASQDSVYLYANNAAVVTSQQDLSFWADANFTKVFHLADGSSLNVKSSTGGTQTNHSATATTGTIDGAGAFVTGSSLYVDGGSANPVTTSVSAEAWIKRSANNLCNTILGNTDASGGYLLAWGNVGTCTSGAGMAMIVKGSATDTGRYITGDVASVDRWNYVVGTFSGSGVANVKGYVNALEFATYPGTPTTFNNGNMTATANNTLVGATNSASPSLFANGSIDEARERSTVSTPNWISTTYNYRMNSPSQIQGLSFSIPTVVQYATCQSPGSGFTAAAVCTLPFPVTSGGILVLEVTAINTASQCPVVPNDSAGNVYTSQIGSSYTGSLQHYYTCIYTAPITATGADIVTTFTGGDISAVVYEIKNTSTSGILTTSTDNTSPPSTISLTCGSTNCFAICATVINAGSTASATTAGGGLQLFNGQVALDTGGHQALATLGTGIVASGSQSCSFDVGLGASMVLLGNSPTATRRRPSQVY